MQKSSAAERIVAKFEANSLLRDSGIVTFGAGISKALTLVFSIIAARSLDTAEYGAIRTSVSWATVVTIPVVPLAHTFTTYLAKYRNHHSLRDLYFSSGLAVSGLLLVITVLANGVLVSLTNIVDAGVWFVLFGLVVFHLYAGFLRGVFGFLKLSIFQSLQGLLQLGVLVLLTLFGGLSTFSVLVIYGLSWIVTAVLLESLSYNKNEVLIVPPSKDTLRELLSFSVPLIASYALHAILINGDVLMLRVLSDEIQVSYYGVANSLAAMILFVGNSVFSVILPSSSHLSIEEGFERMKRGAILVAGVCLLVVSSFWIAGDLIIELLFTTRYLPGVPSLKVLALGMSFYSLMNVMSGYWIAHNRSYAYAFVLACTLLSAFVLYWIFVPIYGALGAALSFSGATLLGFILMVVSLGWIRKHT